MLRGREYDRAALRGLPIIGEIDAAEVVVVGCRDALHDHESIVLSARRHVLVADEECVGKAGDNILGARLGVELPRVAMRGPGGAGSRHDCCVQS